MRRAWASLAAARWALELAVVRRPLEIDGIPAIDASLIENIAAKYFGQLLCEGSTEFLLCTMRCPRFADTVLPFSFDSASFGPPLATTRA